MSEPVANSSIVQRLPNIGQIFVLTCDDANIGLIAFIA